MMNKNIVILVALITLGSLLCQQAFSQSSERNDVLVLINSNSPRSQRVGLYYASKRNVAASNIVYLNCPLKRDLAIQEYIDNIENPLKTWFSQHPATIKYIVLSQDFSFAVGIRDWRGGFSLETTLGYMATKNLQDYLIKDANGQFTGYANFPPVTAYFNSVKYLEEFAKAPLYITARLEANSEQQAKALVDKAIAAEQQGLQGKSYVLPGSENDYGFLQKNAEMNIAVHQTMQKMLGTNYSIVDNYHVDAGGNVEGYPSNIGAWDSIIRASNNEIADNVLFYYGGFTNYVAQYYDVFQWAPGSLAFDLRLGGVAENVNPVFYEWQGNYIAVTDPNIAHSGNNCILFDNSEIVRLIRANQSTFSWNALNGGYADVPVTLNQATPQNIIIGAYAKADAVVGQVNINNFALSAKITYTDNTSETIQLLFDAGTYAWKEFSKRFVPVKPIKNIYISIVYSLPGKAWIDDLYIIEENNPQRNLMTLDNWTGGSSAEGHYPGFEFENPTSDPNYKGGNNYLSRPFAFEAIKNGAAAAIGKSSHDEYWRGGVSGIEDNKTLEYFLKGYSFGESAWMTAYRIPSTHLYLGDPLYNPAGVSIKSVRDNVLGTGIRAIDGRNIITRDQILELKGSAFNGAFFKNYSIEYVGSDGVPRTDGIILTSGGSSAVRRSVLGTWDISKVPVGKYSLKLTVHNSSGQDFFDSLDVEVCPSDPVIAVADRVESPENNTAVINPLSNDILPSNEAIRITSVTQPAHGKAEIKDDHTILYTPFKDFYGSDSFTYQISSGTGKSDSSAVNISVLDVPDTTPPIVTLVSPKDGSMVANDITLLIQGYVKDDESEVVDLMVTAEIYSPTTKQYATPRTQMFDTSNGQWTLRVDPKYLSLNAKITLWGYANDALDNGAENLIGVFYVGRDTDHDGIFDDGNRSGVIGDNYCTAGNTINCDDNCISVPNANQADQDADKVGDTCDNCRAVANPDQRDANASEDDNLSKDGIQHYGDVCDADFNESGLVGLEDYSLWRQYYRSNVPPAPADLDVNHNGLVDMEDYSAWRQSYRQSPGPGVGD